MRKLLIISAFVLVHLGCISTPVLFAQTLPITITVTWDPNPAGQNVSSYDVKLDNGTTIPVIATATPSAQVSVSAFGHHVVEVIAKSVSITCDDPTQCNTVSISVSAPATAGFTLNPSPGQPKINKITKP